METMASIFIKVSRSARLYCLHLEFGTCQSGDSGLLFLLISIDDNTQQQPRGLEAES